MALKISSILDPALGTVLEPFSVYYMVIWYEFWGNLGVGLLTSRTTAMAQQQEH